MKVTFSPHHRPFGMFNVTVDGRTFSVLNHRAFLDSDGIQSPLNEYLGRYEILDLDTDESIRVDELPEGDAIGPWIIEQFKKEFEDD